MLAYLRRWVLDSILGSIACNLEEYAKACSNSLRQFLTDLYICITCDWAVWKSWFSSFWSCSWLDMHVPRLEAGTISCVLRKVRDCLYILVNGSARFSCGDLSWRCTELVGKLDGNEHENYSCSDLLMAWSTGHCCCVEPLVAPCAWFPTCWLCHYLNNIRLDPTWGLDCRDGVAWKNNSWLNRLCLARTFRLHPCFPVAGLVSRLWVLPLWQHARSWSRFVHGSWNKFVFILKELAFVSLSHPTCRMSCGNCGISVL